MHPQDCTNKENMQNLWGSHGSRLMGGKRSDAESLSDVIVVEVKEETKKKLKVKKHSTTANCRYHRKGMLNVECELRDVVPSIHYNLPPFTSDYRDPRTHPPKNN